jgi:hypothetical protein
MLLMATLKCGSLFDTEKLFLPYLTLRLQFVPYRTFRPLLPLTVLMTHKKTFSPLVLCVTKLVHDKKELFMLSATDSICKPCVWC